MWSKYFMRGIDIQKYSNVFKGERVFSYVGCLSLSGFDEIFVFEAGRGLTEKAELERKRLQNVHVPMLRVFNCVTKWRERERESAVSGSQNVRECVLSL